MTIALNQSPPFADLNLYAADRVLRDAVEREGGADATEPLLAFGAKCGTADAFERGRLANDNPPRLIKHDARGNRIDKIEFHPAYHACMTLSMAEGLHAAPWEHLLRGEPPVAGSHVARCAGTYLATQMESGHGCPITMTHAAVPTLLGEPSIAKAWLPKILSRTYDPRCRPLEEKTSVTLGMGMTEPQGGTDVRTNTTAATPISAPGPGQRYEINGHKWFMSAPMCDAFVILAQTPRGLSCFLLPRWRDDGGINGIQFRRLKSKLGNRSNASSEVDFVTAEARMIGEDGRGIPAIMEMVAHTRLDCAIASAALMRLATATAVHHARHRRVFQKTLIDHPMMTAVLADLALDVEAATALTFRLAASFDRAATDPAATAWRRLMTPVTKYWACKLAPAHIYEAMECLGGNGYVEDFHLARAYREAPVNAIWEGSGNVMALDVVRVATREPEIVSTVLATIRAEAKHHAGLLRHVNDIEALLQNQALLEQRGRLITERLATVAAAAILTTHVSEDIGEAFYRTRLSGLARRTFGQDIESAEARQITQRVLP